MGPEIITETNGYMAPETLVQFLGGGISKREYNPTNEADIWSMCISFYALVTCT